jgi:iron-sulfur cluster assembly protein
MITVSEKALHHLLELMVSEGITPDTHHLRVSVTSGGCSGLSYKMDFDDEIDPTDTVVDIDGGLKVLIDRKSLLFLYGTNLEYSDGLHGKGFEWKNPNANRVCGCGTSFSL